MPFYKSIFFVFLTAFTQYTQALGNQDLLPAEQAFEISAEAISAEQIEVNWVIADGYYLYRNKTSITSLSDGIELGVSDMPAGKTKHDEFFGDVVIYRNQLKISIPVTNKKSLSSLKIQVKYQGCADIGICYPPQKKVFTIDLPSVKVSSKSDPIKQLVNGFKGLNLGFFQDELAETVCTLLRIINKGLCLDHQKYFSPNIHEISGLERIMYLKINMGFYKF